MASGNFQSIEFILDSGADCTMVPKRLAQLAGVTLPSRPNTSVSGITSVPMPAYTGELQFRLGGEEFKIRCLFTESNRTPFLLGRIDFFTMFNVTFSGQHCCIELEKV